MAHSIRAIYRAGQLQLIDPVSLSEGEEVELVIVPQRDRLRSLLHDLIIETDVIKPYSTADEMTLMQAVMAALDHTSSLSATLIEERRSGP